MSYRLHRWGQNLAPDHHPARHGRGRIWLYREGIVEKDGRPVDVDVAVASVGLEWSHLWRYRALGLKVSTIGEETLDVHLHGIVFSYYWHVDLNRFDGRLVRLPRLRLEAGITRNALEWKIGDVPDFMPDREVPRWRRGRLSFFTLTTRILGRWKTEETALAHRQVAIPLPENDYLADLTLRRLVRYRTRLPWRRTVGYFVDVDMPRPGPGLPFPDRKYGGADGIFGMSTKVRRPADTRDGEWIGSAVGDAVRRTLENRCRYGRGIEDSGLEEVSAR